MNEPVSAPVDAKDKCVIAREQIVKILRKHDLAGVFIIADQEGFLPGENLDCSWTVFEQTADAHRFKGRQEYGLALVNSSKMAKSFARAMIRQGVEYFQTALDLQILETQLHTEEAPEHPPTPPQS